MARSYAVPGAGYLIEANYQHQYAVPKVYVDIPGVPRANFASLTPSSALSATLGRSRPIAEALAPSSALAAVLNGIHAESAAFAPISALAATLHRSRALHEALTPVSLQAANLSRNEPLSASFSSTSLLHDGVVKFRTIIWTPTPTSLLSATVLRSRALSEAITPTSLLGAGQHKGLYIDIGPNSSTLSAQLRSRLLVCSIHSVSQLTASLGRQMGLSAALNPFSSVNTTNTGGARKRPSLTMVD